MIDEQIRQTRWRLHRAQRDYDNQKARVDRAISSGGAYITASMTLDSYYRLVMQLQSQLERLHARRAQLVRSLGY